MVLYVVVLLVLVSNQKTVQLFSDSLQSHQKEKIKKGLCYAGLKDKIRPLFFNER